MFHQQKKSFDLDFDFEEQSNPSHSQLLLWGSHQNDCDLDPLLADAHADAETETETETKTQADSEFAYDFYHDYEYPMDREVSSGQQSLASHGVCSSHGSNNVITNHRDQHQHQQQERFALQFYVSSQEATASQRHGWHVKQRRESRFSGAGLLRIGTIILLLMAIVVGFAAPIASHESRNVENSSTLSYQDMASLNDPRTIHANPTSTPSFYQGGLQRPEPEQKICVGVSYELQHMPFTAKQVLSEQGTTLKTGLEIAVQVIVKGFEQDFDDAHGNRIRQRRRLLQSNAVSLMQPEGISNPVPSNPTDPTHSALPQRDLLYFSNQYSTTITGIVDFSAFCGSPFCLVIQQHVCVVLGQATTLEDDGLQHGDIRSSLEAALKKAIDSGELIRQVPPEHMP